MSQEHTGCTEDKFYIVNLLCILTFGELEPYNGKCHS